MSVIKDRRLPIREKRDGAIIAYAGQLAALHAEAGEGRLVPRIRTFAQDTRSDLQVAAELLSTIRDLAIVVHGPAGCFSSLRVAEHAVVTGLTERDSILGGDKKLRASIHQVIAQHRPGAVAVVCTPVAAINNDDADAVVAELRDEYGLPIVFIRTDAFKSKLSNNGADLVAHALLRETSIARKSAERQPGIVLISTRESEEDIDTLSKLLATIGVTAFTFPRYSRADNWAKVPTVSASLAIDPSDADFVGHALFDEFEIPYVSVGLPIGLRGTSQWLTGLARVLGKTTQAEELVASKQEVLDTIRSNFSRHKGAQIYVSAPPDIAFSLVGLVEELGLGVSGLTLTYVDKRHETALAQLASKRGDLPVLVGEGQAFEEANLLRKVGANLYIGVDCPVSHVLRIGIPVLDLVGLPFYGYAGAERVAEAMLRRLENTALAQFLSEGTESYSDGWLAKSTHWFIKHEVK
jgi:nitrogenase molybdenum-cofactor synthesis protein NifE